jgi:NAD(P)-dependent dehydrogenase (short-subunit alcohol dehydrogenase family)
VTGKPGSPDGRVCLLTGAGGTLGTEFCRRYRSRYRIAAVYHRTPPEPPHQDAELVDPLRPAEPLPENEHPLFAIRADLAEDAELRRVVELTLARFGRIDLLVNAAVHSIWAPIVDSRALLESAERQFRINALVPLRLATEVAHAFWRDRDEENRALNRNVVNVSSIAGIYVYPNRGQSVYSATKAALNNLTCHMAAEFGALGVRVNATAPDTFPALVATERAAESIIRLDEGSMSGSILVLTQDGERTI